MICQDCQKHPAVEGLRTWRPTGSGKDLRWQRLEVCEHCYGFAMSNTIKYGYSPKGRTYRRECVGVAGPNDTPVYEQIEESR